MDGKRERRPSRAAAPLDDADVQLPFTCFEREAKAGRRRFARSFRRAEEKHAGAARLRRHREPAQILVAAVAEPRQQGVARSGAQHLFRRPQRIPPPRRTHHGQLREVDPGGGERRGIRQMRRGEPDDALSGIGQPHERRQADLELADSLLRAQDFRQGADRPAAAGQFPVKRRITRGYRAGKPPRRGAAPDGMGFEETFESRHG